MGGDDEPKVAFRRRVSGKKARVRRRAGNDASASDADDVKAAPERRPIVKPAASSRTTRRLRKDPLVQISKAPKLPGYGSSSDEGKKEAEPGHDSPADAGLRASASASLVRRVEDGEVPRDYSAAGLARLAAETLRGAPVAALQPQKSLDGDSRTMHADHGVTDVHPGGIAGEKIPTQRVLSARASTQSKIVAPPAPNGTPASGGRSFSGAGYIALSTDNDALMETLEGATIVDSPGRNGLDATGVRLGIGADDSDDSAGSAWEEEQLRRAGHGPTERRRAAAGAASDRALAIVEEEGLLRGGRGEVGMSLTETCADNLTARVDASKERLSKLESELEAVTNAQRRGATEMEVAQKCARQALSRREYYRELSSYLTNLHEMLEETGGDTAKFVNVEVERLAALARVRTTAVDEFGRARRAAFDFERDGYESPPVETSSELADKLSARETGNDGDGDVEMGNEAVVGSLRSYEQNDPLLAVADEFKSIPALTARFIEWKAQYPADYDVAYGDLSLGKMSGALALATRLAGQTDWLDVLPTRAKAAAALKSRATTWVSLALAADWEPQSMASTAMHARSMSRLRSCLEDRPSELLIARVAFLRSALDVLRWKVESLSSAAASLVENERAWAARAAVKCARTTGTLAFAIGTNPKDSKDLENLVVHSLFCDLILPFAQEQPPSAAAKFLLFSVEDGCFTPRKSGKSSFAFPSPEHPRWGSIRGALASAVGNDPKASNSQRYKCALERIGGSSL